MVAVSECSSGHPPWSVSSAPVPALSAPGSHTAAVKGPISSALISPSLSTHVLCLRDSDWTRFLVVQSLASALSLTQVRCERMCQLSDTPSVRSPQLRTSSTADFTMSLIEGSSLETSLSLGRTSSLFHCPPVCNFYHKFGNIVLNLISRDEEIAVNSIIATERWLASTARVSGICLKAIPRHAVFLHFSIQ